MDQCLYLVNLSDFSRWCNNCPGIIVFIVRLKGYLVSFKKHSLKYITLGQLFKNHITTTATTFPCRKRNCKKKIKVAAKLYKSSPVILGYNLSLWINPFQILDKFFIRHLCSAGQHQVFSSADFLRTRGENLKFWFS